MNQFERKESLENILYSTLPSGDKLAQLVNLFKDLEAQYERNIEDYRKLIRPEDHIVNVIVTPAELKERGIEILKNEAEVLT